MLPEQAQAEAALRAKVRRVEIARDEITNAPSFVGSAHEFLTGAGGVGMAVSQQALERVPATDPHRAVKAFIDEYRSVFGHRSDVLNSAAITKDYVTAHNGMRTMVWQQQLDSVRVFEATLQAHLTARGELINVASHFVANPEEAAQRGGPNRAARLAQPAVSARAAVAAAARNIGEQLTEAEVSADGAASGLDARQNFTAPTLLGSEARYVWLPMDAQTVRLCWEVICTGRTTGFMFRILVDAETGELQVRQTLTEHLSNASYRVFTSDSPSPFSPGYDVPSSVQPPTVSRVLVTTPGLNLTASPNGWIDDGVMETRGNNVDAHTDLDANNSVSGSDLPRPQAVGAGRVFDPPLDLTQDPATYGNAAVVNLFYWSNFMHDKLYELGFTEQAGNFQIDNFGRGGVGNDAVQADAQDGSGTNNANFSTPPDGFAGRMQMYRFTGPTPNRDGDFDAEIICHEYTHGLTNRMVGGGVGMSALQSRGMGEGWSDFYGLALLSQPADNPNANYASGAYASYLSNGLTDNYYYGIRRYPYSTNLAKNPLTLKDIDPTQASAHPGIPRSPIAGSTANEVHNMGEVWCVTLWDARANLIAKYGGAAGNQLILQLVTDALRLSPANPTFLQARDAILQADLASGGANRAELWAAFAKRGMGASAYVPANSTTTGIVEAYDTGDNLNITPTTAFGASATVGGSATPSSQAYFIFNSGTSPITWTAAKTQPWVTLSATSGTLAIGGNTTVTASLNANVSTLPVGTFTDTISFKDSASSATHTRAVTVTISPPSIPAYSNQLNSQPAWTTSGEWAFGQSTGGGGTQNGFRDPTSGATGTNVFGINLAGDYLTSVGSAAYLTAGPFNLAGYANTRVQFQRWLNTDYQPWVAATVEVSRNGTTWTKIWDNGTTGPLTATAWTKVQHDLAAVADNQPSVYIRWGHQVLRSDAVPYAGWNIDDFELLGQIGAAPATITSQPVSQVASIGSSVTFSVTATGLPVPTYQWNFNGVPLSGATNSTLILPNVQVTNAGSYNVVVSNSLATVTSTTVTLSGTASTPTITSQPANVAIVSGQNATFSVTATGTPPLVYQWRRNGFPVAGATNTSFTLPGASRSDADYYDVLVGSGLTAATSQAARLTVAPIAYPTVVVPDPAWNLQAELANGTGLAIVQLADGRAYVAGSFTDIGGVAQTCVARVKADGTLDTTFVPPIFDNSIRALGVQSDGKLIVGGDFLRVNGQLRNRLARLNADGSVDTGFGATANNTVSALAVQADGRILVGGSFTAFAGTLRNSLVRLNVDGTVDAGFLNRGVSAAVNAIALQADGKILLGGAFTSYIDAGGISTPRTRMARLNADGTLDAFNAAPSSTVNSLALQTDGKVVVGGALTGGVTRYNPDGTTDATFVIGTGFTGGSVNVVAIQSDGKILVGGSFTTLVSTTINRFARLNTDGSRDSTFQTLGFNATVSAIAVQSTGQIVVGGNFTSYFNGTGASTSRSRFARLNSNGTLGSGYSFSGIRQWGTVNALLPLPGGKLLITGIFQQVQGTASALGIARINADGSLDTTFAPGSGTNSNINAAALQPDGKIVIGGPFTTYSGSAAVGIARLNSDGTLDTTFNPGSGLTGVNTISILPGGKIFVAGTFTTVSGVAQNRVAVFNPTGSLDTSFTPGSGAGSTVFTSVVQPDGKIIIGGQFSTYNGAAAVRIARLNANGTLDSTFTTSPGATSDVNALVLQADGKVVVGGLFTTFHGQPRSGVARLAANGTLDATFVPPAAGSVYNVLAQEDGKVLLRGQFASVDGAANTAFLARLNSDGSRDTTFASAGFADSNGRPSMLVMRDSGQVIMHSNGVPTASATQAGAPPIITVQPANQVAFIGGGAGFSVTTASVLPVTYQWLFNGAPIIGATGSTLSLAGVQLATAGSYQVVVTNELGSTPSSTASLVVNKLPATIIISNLAQTYDGSPHFVSVTTAPVALAVNVTYDGNPVPPTNAGSYTVSAVVSDPTYQGSASATLEIAKAPATVALDGLNAVYDGTPKLVTATSTPSGLAIAITYDGSPTPPTNAGSYAVSATIVDPNYVGTLAGILTIAKAPAIVALGNLSAIYDGTSKAATAATTPFGLAVALTYNASPTPPTNAGSYAVLALVVDQNYSGSAAGTLTIAKAPATVTLGSLATVYDGSAKAATATTTPAGLAVTFTYNGAPTAPINAGDYAVIGTINSANYVGSTTGMLTIAKATATIALGSLNPIYDGTPKAATATTSPAGLAVLFTYDGSPTAPTNVGSYLVEANVTDANYTGNSSATLNIASAPATITLSNLLQAYDGTPRSVVVTTVPASLAFSVTYNGEASAPTAPGSYAIVATITDPNYAGSTSGVLVVGTTVLVRHAPGINGGIDGSIQVASAENIALTGNAWISGDLIVRGTPTVETNGAPTLAGIRDSAGAADPSNYFVTLNGTAALRYVVRRVDATPLPTVLAPPAPQGAHDVVIATARQLPDDWAVVRDIRIVGDIGDVAVPPGTFGEINVAGASNLVLGATGSAQPSVYNLQRLALHANSVLKVLGPVVLTVAQGLTVTGTAGDPANPSSLVLRVADGGVALTGNAKLFAQVIAPNGTVTVGNATLRGTVIADGLVLEGNGLVEQTHP